MRITFRHFHVVVPQKFLYGVQIRSSHHETTGKCVGQVIPVKILQRGRAKLKELLMDCCHIEFDHLGGVIGYDPKNKRCDTCQ